MSSLFENVAYAMAGFTVITTGFKRAIDRIPALARKTAVAVRAVRKVWDEIRGARQG